MWNLRANRFFTYPTTLRFRLDIYHNLVQVRTQETRLIHIPAGVIAQAKGSHDSSGVPLAWRLEHAGSQGSDYLVSFLLGIGISDISQLFQPVGIFPITINPKQNEVTTPLKQTPQMIHTIQVFSLFG